MHPAAREFKWQINAAEGYLELGMPAEAWAELAGLHPTISALPEITLLQLHILNKLGRWEDATTLGEATISSHPMGGDFYLVTSYAKRRFRSVAEAKALLLTGEPVLNAEAIFHYNVGCYDCLLGNLDEAVGRLERAFLIDPRYRQTALDDEDLTALRVRLAAAR